MPLGRRQPRLFGPKKVVKNLGVKPSSKSKDKKPTDWSYHEEDTGPEQWLKKFAGDGVSGTRQSPIAFHSNDAKYAAELSSEAFRIWHHDSGPAELYNTGKSVQVEYKGRHFMCGGGLPSLYQVAQYHFHWGESDSNGGEHIINGIPHALELHIVCYDSVQYSSCSEAAKNPDGLALLGVLFQIGPEDEHLTKLLTELPKIQKQKPEKKIDFSSGTLDDLLPSDLSRFYRYSGSLTIPPLFESVTWTVFDEVKSVSPEQMEKFRSLQPPGSSGLKCITTNQRPVQPLNGRVIYKSFSEGLESASKAPSP